MEVLQKTAKAYSYGPVIAIFSTAGLVAWAASLGLMGFMGVALAMLACLKLMDIPAFVKSFKKYDLVTKRWPFYGKIYPFLELAIALGFLSSLVPYLTGIASLIVGCFGAWSVLKAVYIDKMDLNCACVGGNSKVPLGVVSFLENGMMVGMGVVLVVRSMG
jgi:hypothetical protein